MPVHQFVQDSTLLDKGLRNYWGYNTIALPRAARAYACNADDPTSRASRCRSSRRW